MIGLIYMKPDYEILPHHCTQLLPLAVYLLSRSSSGSTNPLVLRSIRVSIVPS